MSISLVPKVKGSGMAQVKAMRAMNLNTQVFIVHFSLSSIALNAAGYVEVGRVFLCRPRNLQLEINAWKDMAILESKLCKRKITRQFRLNG